MSSGYSVPEYFFVVSNEDGTWGIYETLDLAKEAVEKHQADNGFYVKWTLKDGVNTAKRFDGTFLFNVATVERNKWECPLTLVPIE